MEYTNALSFAPAIDFKPGGILGGALFSDRERDYRDQLSVLQLMQELKYKEEMAKQDEYARNATVREEERAYKLADFEQKGLSARSMSTPGYFASQRGLEEGRATEALAKGRVARETADGDILTSQAENRGKQRTAWLSQALQQLKQVNNLTPGMKGQMWSHIRGTAPQDIRAQLPEDYSPGMEAAMETALRDSAEQLRKMAQDKQQQTANAAVHTADRASQLEGVKYTANKALEGRMESIQTNESQRRTEIRRKLASGEEMSAAEQAEASRDLQAEVNKLPHLASMSKALEFMMMEGEKQPGTLKNALEMLDKVRAPEFDRMSGGRLPNPYGSSAPSKEFKTAEEANAAVKAGRIKSGDVITVNGRKATVK